ncbi:unnamed protein product [Cochlearia groenlandica]
MALSPEALDDLKKIIAAQVAEAMSQLLPQQISQQLTLEREKQAREANEVPTYLQHLPDQHRERAKGTTAMTHAELSEPEEKARRRRSHAAQRRPTETIVGQRFYISSSDEYYGINASDRSRRSQTLERHDRATLEIQRDSS